MASGTPVLTTRSGAIGEYLENGKGAILVEEKNSEAIAAEIVKFFSNKSYREKLQQESRSYILRYDVRREIKKAEELLLETANEK